MQNISLIMPPFISSDFGEKKDVPARLVAGSLPRINQIYISDDKQTRNMASE